MKDKKSDLQVAEALRDVVPDTQVTFSAQVKKTDKGLFTDPVYYSPPAMGVRSGKVYRTVSDLQGLNLGTVTINSVLQNSTGSGKLNKNGAGTLNLGGANTFTGGTTTAGRFLLNGALSTLG